LHALGAEFPPSFSYASAAHRALHSFPTRRSSDLVSAVVEALAAGGYESVAIGFIHAYANGAHEAAVRDAIVKHLPHVSVSISSEDRKSTRLNSSHVKISYAVFCLKKKKKQATRTT